MDTLKFSQLDVFNLNLSNLAGLTSETLQKVKPQLSLFGSVGTDTYNKLDTDLTVMKSKIDRPPTLLTSAIHEANKKCDATLREIKRMVKAGTQSTLPERVEAGKLLMHLLEGFWHLNREPLITQITMTNELLNRYNESPELSQAATVLTISEMFTALASDNNTLDTLYHDRLEEQVTAAPAATRMKSTVANGYTGLCSIILKAASLHPENEGLQKLIHTLDALRKKYSVLSPAKIDIRYATVNAIPNYLYTGKRITPIPSVTYNGEELVFTIDFKVTYRNNVNVSAGAVVVLHGCGRFTGTQERTFTIELKDNAQRG